MIDLLDGPFFTLEYGFLAFAVALVGQHITDYTALLSESESARKILAQQKDRIEELSHQVVLSVDEGIVYLDERGSVRLWNPMMEQLTGRAASTSIGL